jgi:hypothetical protein
VSRLERLLVERDTLSVGVARNQLVIEGVATDPRNPVLGDLAARLHRHQIGAITFRRGIHPQELREILSELAIEADRAGQPYGLRPDEDLRKWSHVRLYPMNYERLELMEGDEPQREDDDEVAGRTRATQLWVGLARAALAVDETQPRDAPIETDPKAVATAITRHPANTAYDQVIVGYMLQIADELRSGQTREGAELQRRMSNLVSSLDPGTLHRLLDMGGDRTQRRRFLLDAAQGLAVDAVVDLVRAAADTSEQTISHSMLRMLQKLAQHADRGTGRRRVVAEENAREQIAQLVRGWSLRDPNPDAYRLALQRMATTESVFAVSPEQRFKPEPHRLIEMALEVNEVGEPVFRAVDALLEAGELEWITATLRDSAGSQVARTLWERVATPDRIAAVTQAEPLDAALLDQLVERAGLAAVDPLLDALARSEASQTRRILIDRIVKLGPEIGPMVLRRLPDDRWFVTRNLLGILGQLPAPPPGFDGAAYLDHPDARVRREVLRVLVRDPVGRERAIARAIADADARTVHLGLTAALEGCPDAALPQVVARATGAPNVDLRVLAVRVLGATPTPMARDALLGIAAPRKSLLGSKLPPKTPEYLAALAALRDFRSDPRVLRALEAAARSRDEEVSRAAGRALA